jgi:DNA-binding GntR family transcriptional regulator
MKRNAIENTTQQLKEDIQNGSFKPYNILPTRRALADQFGTTPDTISKVIKGLEIEGILVKGKGRTMRVNIPRERITTNNETFRDYMKSLGHDAKTENIETTRIIEAAPQIAKKFRVPAGTRVAERYRRDIVDGIVYRYSRKYYLAKYISEEDIHKLNEDPTHDIKSSIKSKKPLARIQEIIIARTITQKEEADIFNAPKGLPILEQWKINYAADKEVTFISYVAFNAYHFEKTYDYAPDNEPQLTSFTQGENN